MAINDARLRLLKQVKSAVTPRNAAKSNFKIKALTCVGVGILFDWGTFILKLAFLLFILMPTALKKDSPVKTDSVFTRQ